MLHWGQAICMALAFLRCHPAISPNISADDITTDGSVLSAVLEAVEKTWKYVDAFMHDRRIWKGKLVAYTAKKRKTEPGACEAKLLQATRNPSSP